MANVLLLTTPNPPTWSGNGVASMEFIGYGGEVDWSPDGTKLAFDRRDGDGIYQIYTMNPDGTGEVCISDPAGTNAPPVDHHKGWPCFHPSGDYLLCQAEMDHGSTKAYSEPGRGLFNDVWCYVFATDTWYQLTDYDWTAGEGVLNPRFNHAGDKVFWAQRTGATGGPFGQWRLNVADFTVTEGVPAISNVNSFIPGGKYWFESHGFSEDDSRIIYTGDTDRYNTYSFDIYSADLDGSNVTNLTDDQAWDEHAHYAPHGDYIAYMSSRLYPSYDGSQSAANGLKSELFVMDADGTNKRRLTGFNIPGHAEYDAERSAATSVAWKPDGTQLAVCQLMLEPPANGGSYDTLQGRRLWIITLEGAYA